SRRRDSALKMITHAKIQREGAVRGTESERVCIGIAIVGRVRKRRPVVGAFSEKGPTPRQEIAHAGFRIEPDRCGGLSRRSARTLQAAEKERRADADVGLET